MSLLLQVIRVIPFNFRLPAGWWTGIGAIQLVLSEHLLDFAETFDCERNKGKITLKKLKAVSIATVKQNISFGECLLVRLSVTLQMPYTDWLPGNLYSIHPHFSS